MGEELTLSVVWVHQSTWESHVPPVGLSSSATDSRIVLLVRRAELVSKLPCCAVQVCYLWLGLSSFCPALLTPILALLITKNKLPGQVHEGSSETPPPPPPAPPYKQGVWMGEERVPGCSELRGTLVPTTAGRSPRNPGPSSRTS